ncbi:TonB-dependent receptor domain-containing protein [Aliarcobacter lanthieri]|uniref:TonB-dependent receptor domain-containing protein n=1 Tax=Aliarcobacter lanthieri TaxID=1355374 RepID=UPI003AAD7762
MKITMARTVAAALLVASSSLSANETTKLDAVQVVTAGGYEQNIADAAASISVITATELEKKSYSDVTDALKNVPGINVQGNGSRKTISIRGMGSEYTLFLIDGKPVNSSEAYAIRGGIPESQVNYMPPLEAIERIEIIRGPASSLYGSDAIGGVINVITKKHQDKATASIRTEYLKAASSNKVNNATSNTSVYVNAPIIEKILSFQLNASLMDTSEAEHNVLGADAKFEKKSVGGKLIYSIDENNTISGGYSYNIQERTHNPGKSISQYTTGRGTNTDGFTMDGNGYVYNNSGKQVGWDGSATSMGTTTTYNYTTDNTKSNTKIERTNYNLDHQAKYDKFSINSYLTHEKDKSSTQDTEFKTFSANTQGTYFFDTNSLSIGLNYKKEKLSDNTSNAAKPDGSKLTEMERYQWALFAEDTWQVTDDLALTLSGRYDDNEKFGSEFSPKAYAVYSLTDNLNLKGGITSGYKAPSLRASSDDFATASMGGDMIGNPDLKPEKSVNYEAGLAYDNSDLGLGASLMLFQIDFKDKLMRTDLVCAKNTPCTYNGKDYPASSNGYTAYKNVDDAESKGIELTTSYDILENLKYRHSYTYNKTKQKSGSDKGEPFTDSPKHMFNAGLDWDVTSKLLLWTQVNYSGKTTGNVPQGGGDLGLEKKAYTLVDLGGVYNYDKKLQFLAGIYNVANRTNDIVESDVNRTNERNLDGRRFSVAMNMKF